MKKYFFITSFCVLAFFYAYAPALPDMDTPQEHQKENTSLSLNDTGAARITSLTVPGDTDGDGAPNPNDNCPNKCNPLQLDADNDGEGDLCDTTPGCGGCNEPLCETECTWFATSAVYAGCSEESYPNFNSDGSIVLDPAYNPGTDLYQIQYLTLGRSTADMSSSCKNIGAFAEDTTLINPANELKVNFRAEKTFGGAKGWDVALFLIASSDRCEDGPGNMDYPCDWVTINLRATPYEGDNQLKLSASSNGVNSGRNIMDGLTNSPEVLTDIPHDYAMHIKQTTVTFYVDGSELNLADKVTVRDMTEWNGVNVFFVHAALEATTQVLTLTNISVCNDTTCP